MNKKEKKLLIVVIVLFILIDISFYFAFTKNYINRINEALQAKSIEVDEYLPFADDSKIVKYDAKNKIEEDIPIVDGAAALFPVYSSFVHALYPESSVIYENGDFTSDSKMQYTNTRGAYKSLVDGDRDIIFCAEPSIEQLEYAKENNVELELVEIGYEAFVFIVNSNNDVDDLSITEIKDIYEGKITNWKEVGGINKPIDALTRNAGSGSQTTMLKFMGDRKIRKNIFGIFGPAIGFSFRYYIEDIVNKGEIKMLSIDGIYPSKENIRDKTYPIIGNLYAVYDKNNTNPNISKFIDFILSEEGQKIIEESGYVSL